MSKKMSVNIGIVAEMRQQKVMKIGVDDFISRPSDKVLFDIVG